MAICSFKVMEHCASLTTTACIFRSSSNSRRMSMGTRTINRRTLQNDYGPEIDYFSAWLISLSLRAIAADGHLWDQLNPSHDEFLLLDHSDLRRNETSARLGLLLTHPDPHARELAMRIREFVSLPVSAVPRPGLTIKVPPSAQHSTYADRSTSLASWMISRVETPDHVKAGDTAPADGHPGFSVDRHMILYSRITLAAGLAVAGAALISVWLLIAAAVIYTAGLAWAFTRYQKISKGECTRNSSADMVRQKPLRKS